MLAQRWFRRGLLVALLGVALPASSAPAGDLLTDEISLAFQPGDTVAERTDIVVTEQSGDCPATFDITYYVYSDYIFRGINFSEYAGEGREKPNHQMTVALGIDMAQWLGHEPGSWGTFAFETFFEWYAAQDQLDPVNGGQNLQEVDYILSWCYPLEEIETDLTLGWTYYLFPNLHYWLEGDNTGHDNDDRTHEWWVLLEHNDAWMWDWWWPENEEGVLNPSFLFVQDIGTGAGNAMWMELGLSHEFELSPKCTITPSWTLGIDHDYYHHFGGAVEKNTWRFANMLWGVDLGYDLTELLRIPDGYGSVALGGFLYFSQALGSAEDNGIIRDEFFGGMSIGYSFGS